MSSPGPGDPRRRPGWWPETRAGRRRDRDARLAALHAWGAAQGWRVLGLHEDLAVRWPVELLQGGRSARAELALAGPWRGRPATVASVLVRPRDGAPDRVVQVVAVEAGVRGWRAAGTWDGSALTPTAGTLAPEVADLAARNGLRPGDELGVAEVELLHARVPGRRAPLDVEGPLGLLDAWVQALTP